VHPYANNRIFIDGSNGQILRHEKYADKPFSEKVMTSLYAIHSGSILGHPGRILMMLSAFLLAGFGITGVLMYFTRRRSGC